MEISGAKILIVDDQSANVMLLEDVLDDAGFENIEGITDSRLVAVSIQRNKPDIVLLDIRMPFLDGFDILKLLGETFIDDMPLVMVLTAESDPQTRAKALSMGAIDFLNKPINNQEVVQRVINLLEFNKRRQCQVGPVESFNVELKPNEQGQAELAMTDPMSGLPNRRAIIKDIVERFSCHRMVACMVINIDGMEQTEHVHGHVIAEKLFREIAASVAKVVELNNMKWGCWGGNQLLLITETISELQLKHFADEIIKVVHAPHYIHALSLSVNARIGICLGEDVYNQANELVRRAQLALPAVGENPRRKVYDTQLEREILRNTSLRSAIPQAIIDDEFELYYQPKVNLADNTLKGVEALVRWNSPIFGVVAPDEFIPLAESSGRMEVLGDWIIRQALSDINVMHKVLKNKTFSVAINVSPVQFTNPNFAKKFVATMQEYGVPPEKVELEVTESLAIDNLENVIDQLNFLRDQGISIALDDFGTGYSSLSYLKRLPLDVLKIDRAFVVDVVENIDSKSMIKGIINLAKVFNFTIVAEGIEGVAEANILSSFGCHIGQGYFYSRPLPLIKFFELFKPSVKTSPIRDVSVDLRMLEYLAS